MSKKVKIILSVIISVIIIVVIFFVIDVIFWQKTKVETTVSIKSGTSSRGIAQELKSDRVIKSDWIFLGLVYLNHWQLQSGVYKIESGSNMIQVVELIHSGKVSEYIVTIPEGWRVSQIDDLLSQKGIIGKDEFTKIAAGSEGYLFPDTYRFPIKSNPEQIMAQMTSNFAKKTTGLKINNQTLTIASIVEREAKADSDRATIASVYYNRLNSGMYLDADPTIQYGKGSWAPITKSDYKNFQSPYNTYLYFGLPPTPICNPGLKSIEAAVNPAKTDYFYFFTTTSGQTIYSKTYQEHLDNLKKFQ